jgi:ribosomal protein L16/L10AE
VAAAAPNRRMPSQMMFPIVMMALFGAYAIYMWKKRSAGIGPGLKIFLERTGYRYAELPPTATMDEQLAHGDKLAKGLAGQMKSGGYQSHMVRDFHGVPIHWKSWSKTTTTGHSIGCNWSAEIRSTTKIQIAEKSLSGVGKALKEAFSNSERVWEAVYPHKVASGDAELDKRFHIYCEDPAAVPRVLAAPGLRELLLGCVEVDVAVYPDEVRFADPMQKNMRAGMGGTLGQMALAGNLEKTMEVSTPVHDRIAELLATLARAAA